MMEGTKPDLLQINISPKNLMRLSTSELFLLEVCIWSHSRQNLTNWSSGEQTLAMPMLRHTQKKSCLLQLELSLRNLTVHILLMVKALYGTRSGGSCWHDKLFDILKKLGFTPSKADPDVWMRLAKDGTCYEYVTVYMDDWP